MLKGECEQCGSAITGKPSMVAKRRYCSHKCHMTARWQIGAMDHVLASRKPANDYGATLCDGCCEIFKRTSPRSRACRTCSPLGYQGFYTHGLTKPERDAMYFDQDGACLVCQKNEATQIDHNHDTGKVRGLLCVPCNLALVHVEKRDWLRAAERYLEIDRLVAPGAW